METKKMYEPVILDSEVACSLCDSYIAPDTWLMEDPEEEIYICMNCWFLEQFGDDELREAFIDLII